MFDFLTSLGAGSMLGGMKSNQDRIVELSNEVPLAEYLLRESVAKWDAFQTEFFLDLVTESGLRGRDLVALYEHQGKSLGDFAKRIVVGPACYLKRFRLLHQKD